MKKLLLSALTVAAVYVAPAMATGVSDLRFGPQQESQGRPIDGVVAIVGNDVITARELAKIGKSRAALESLIIKKLLLQEAAKRNIIIGDTALNIAMKGKRQSRAQLREALTIQQLQQQVTSSLVEISSNEVAVAMDQALKSVNDRVRLVDILIDVPQSATPAELKASQNKTYKVRQLLKKQSGKSVANQFDGVAYNDLGWVKLSQIPTNFARALFSAPTKTYLEPINDRDGIHILKILDRKGSSRVAAQGVPETKVSHILIKTDGNPKAKSKINDIYKQLRKGVDFATLASSYSEDSGSAANKGSLGWAYPGQMVPGFEAVMNRTGVGQTSKPFKTQFGYHILKVHDRRKSSQGSNALEQAARQAVFRRKAGDAWDSWLMNLRQEAYVNIVQ